MKEKFKTVKTKREEKEYLLSIKLLIVNEIEQGKLTVSEAKRKYKILQKATIMNWLFKYGRL